MRGKEEEGRKREEREETLIESHGAMGTLSLPLHSALDTVST